MQAATTIGDVIADSSGSTLYMYGLDNDVTPPLTSDRQRRPPVISPYVTWGGTVTVGAGLTLASTAADIRPNGARLISCNGHLLYTFLNHVGPGDVVGHCMNNLFALNRHGECHRLLEACYESGPAVAHPGGDVGVAERGRWTLSRA